MRHPQWIPVEPEGKHWQLIDADNNFVGSVFKYETPYVIGMRVSDWNDLQFDVRQDAARYVEGGIK
jgi:hypothetical protein